MYGFSVCEIPDVLRVIYFIKLLINVVKFIVPIGLIVMVILDFGKGVVSGDKKPGEIIKLCSNKIIAAVIIFLIPTIVNFVLVFVDKATSYESCWANANISTINSYQVLWDEEVAKWKEEEKRKQEEEAHKNNKGQIDLEYTASNSHTNSINGIKYKLYNQCSEPWGSSSFGSGKSICDMGCAITSGAVIASSANSNITPLDISNSKYKTAWPYSTVNYFSNGAFNCSKGSYKFEDIINNLKKGNVFIIRVNEESKFTSSQHYMALIDIKSDGSEIFVGNSYGNGKGGYSRHGWFGAGVVLTDVHEFHLCVPTQDLINKFK